MIRSLTSAKPLGVLRRRLDQSAVYDRVMRCPLVAYSSYILLRDVFAFGQRVLQEPAAFAQFDADFTLATLARMSQWSFVLLLSIQPLFRLRPVAKSESILPRAGALIAAGVPLMFMQIERAPSNVAFNLLAVTLSLLGNMSALATASLLGRSLAVMPEARRLVQNGPYGVVRHPLYLCELVGAAAVFLQYRSWPAAALLVLAVGLTLQRARWEEDVLARAFPDFAAYRARTAFLIPPDPWRFLASFLQPLASRPRLAATVAAPLPALVLAAALPWKSLL